MMQYKKANSFGNIWTWVIVVFIFVIFTTGIKLMSINLVNSPYTNLDQSSLQYASRIALINTSSYSPSLSQMEQNNVISSKDINDTGGTSKDFALQFFYTQKQTQKLQDRIGVQTVFSLPERLAVTLLGAPKAEFQWLLDIFNWFFWTALLVAVIVFIIGAIK